MEFLYNFLHLSVLWLHELPKITKYLIFKVQHNKELRRNTGIPIEGNVLQSCFFYNPVLCAFSAMKTKEAIMEHNVSNNDKDVGLWTMKEENE